MARHLGDLELLVGELVTGFERPFTGALAGGQ